MGTDKSNVDNAKFIADNNHNAISVPFDVENNPVVGDKAGIPIYLFDFCWRSPIGLLDICVPGLQCLSSIGVLFPKLSENFAGDDTHGVIISCSRPGSKGGFLNKGRFEAAYSPENRIGEDDLGMVAGDHPLRIAGLEGGVKAFDQFGVGGYGGSFWGIS